MRNPAGLERTAPQLTRRIYRGPRGAATLSADLTPLRLAGLEVSALPGQELVFDLRTTAFEGLALSAGVLSGNRSVYTPQAADDDGVVMIGAAHGQGFIRQGGREAQAHDGDAFFMDPNRAYLYLAQPSRACAVRLSRTVMQSLGIDVDAALVRPVRGPGAGAPGASARHARRAAGRRAGRHQRIPDRPRPERRHRGPAAGHLGALCPSAAGRGGA